LNLQKIPVILLREGQLFPRHKVASVLGLLAFAVFINVAAPVSKASAAELLVISSAHCPYCVAWEREIGRSYAVTAEGQRTPLRRFSIEAERPAGFAKIHEVQVTPTFILVERGREVGRIEGYSGGRAFWADFRALLARLHGAG
jgi:hypothetical protein